MLCGMSDAGKRPSSHTNAPWLSILTAARPGWDGPLQRFRSSPTALPMPPAATEQFRDRLNTLTQWSRANPGKLGEAVGTIQPFYLAYRPGDLTDSLCRYGDLASAEASACWKPTAAARSSRPGRERIRLAVVSGQLRRHPVWEVILRGLIAHLDRERFEIFLYHTGAALNEETTWASAQVARFVQGPKPIRQWLGELGEAQPDAIFYPEVGMDSNTCTLASLRLAPLQIAGLGTSDNDRNAHDRLVCLRGAPREPAGSATLPRKTHPVARHRRLYRILLRWRRSIGAGPSGAKTWSASRYANSLSSSTRQDDVLLARIAKAVGATEFWLATPANMPWSAVKLRERISAAFRAEGLDPEVYLRATPWLPRQQFLSFLDEMDIYLDCPAFSGYTTAWQALHCGLPIVTLEGPYLRQRLAAGLMRQVGATDGITASREEYVATAVRWANECRDTGRWGERRVELRGAAPLADGNRAAILAFEQKLWQALRESA